MRDRLPTEARSGSPTMNRMGCPGDETDVYFALSREIYGANEAGLRRKTALLFDGVPLSGRSLLDVGGGSGLMSFYAAARGANPVVCLEPSDAGSNPKMDDQFLEWQAGLGRRANVELARQTLQQLDPADRSYDVVLLHASVNHMDEDACRRLPYDALARATYSKMFDKLARLTVPGGDLIIADAARKNAWAAIGRRSPFAPTIEWGIHAQPRVWAELAEEVGFSNSRVTWRSHDRLGKVGQVALGNPVGGWLTNSAFILHMRRGG